MHLITFDDGNGERIGLLEGVGGDVVDLPAADPELPRAMLGLIEAGEPGLRRLRETGEAAGPGVRLPREAVALRAPLPRPPRNIMAVGKNYAAHAGELAGTASGVSGEVPEYPIVFTKATTSVIGPEEPILAHLDPTASVDYEGEVAVVIGKAGRGISPAQASEHIFGYTALNDVTARRLQQRHSQWFLGKSVDGFCPMGPTLIPSASVPEPSALTVTTSVNGERRQTGVLANLVFPVAELIATLSQGMTLVPSDIIATGTPPGVGVAFDPPRYLRSGDRVAVHVDGIGTLTNPVA